MHLQSLITATLLAVAVTGCVTGQSCPDSDDYSVDADLTEDEVAALMMMWDAGRGGITCQQACDFAHARNNAVEGCVHEAWAAVRAAWLARHAMTPTLRQVYTEIAADEARHAQLAWDLHTWFLGQVDPAQRDQLAAARRAAITGLPALARAQGVADPTRIGLPSLPASIALARHFADGLAAAA